MSNSYRRCTTCENDNGLRDCQPCGFDCRIWFGVDNGGLDYWTPKALSRLADELEASIKENAVLARALELANPQCAGCPAAEPCYVFQKHAKDCPAYARHLIESEETK